MGEFIQANPDTLNIVDMGMGKTVTTLTAVQHMLEDFEAFKVLVIAPLRVAQHTWPEEIAKWDHLDLDYSLILGPPKKRLAATASDAPVHIINVDNLVWLVDQFPKDTWPYDTVVIDESSLFKNSTAKRFKKFKRVRKHIARTILLTGTPAPNGLLDLWSQMYLVDGGKRLLRTFTAYKQTYFESDYMGYTWTLRKGSEEEIYKRVEDVCFRLDAKDHLDMPDRIDHTVDVYMPSGVEKKYRELEKEMLLELSDDDKVTAVTAGVLAGKLLQFANGALYLEDGGYEEMHDAKLRAVKEIADTAQGRPILLAYNYRSDLERLQQWFPKAVAIDKEPGTLDRWNAGEIEMLMAHPASAGHGLNLQRGGSIIVWFGLPWSLEHYQQFNARLHRQGQEETVVIHHIATANTVDLTILEALGNKNATQRGLLDALRKRA